LAPETGENFSIGSITFVLAALLVPITNQNEEFFSGITNPRLTPHPPVSSRLPFRLESQAVRAQAGA